MSQAVAQTDEMTQNADVEEQCAPSALLLLQQMKRLMNLVAGFALVICQRREPYRSAAASRIRKADGSLRSAVPANVA